MSASTATRHLFAGLALLTLAAGPALAQEDLQRVEIRGHVVEAAPRLDVHAACNDIDDQLDRALARTLFEEARYGEVKVQLVMKDGQVETVDAKGVSHMVARKVRMAVNRLECGQKVAGAQLYHFIVDFVDPSAAPRADGSTRVARVRAVRVSG